MIGRKCDIFVMILFIFMLKICLISYIIYKKLEYTSPPLMVYESDVIKYSNVSLNRYRIPRIIHQTSRTHDTPSFWNSTFNSIIEKNQDDFEYRRWSDIEMDKFVKENEPEFYSNTYEKYRYKIQRIDSFRYVLMFHLGGIYIDMDNGCNRPFKDLIFTLESLDPNATHLSCFPRREFFGVESDLLISSVGHPFYKQLISRLHLFNHNYIFHFWTILISTGPIYVSIQERFFHSSQNSVVRLLDFSVFRPMFTWKENGFTWIGRDAHLLFYLSKKSEMILLFCKIFLLILIIFILIKFSKLKRNKFTNLFIIITDYIDKS